MKKKKKLLLKENIENFTKFLDNEILTIENYYPEYCLLVSALKQNFWKLKVILSDDNILNENLNFMLIQAEQKKKRI